MYPERGEGVFVLGIVLVVLSAIVLGLRFWSRALLPGQKFGGDDWMVLASWPFVAAIGIQTCLLMRTGFGNHLASVPHSTFITSMQVLYAGYLTHTIAISLLRISAGLFYGRMFSQASPIFKKLVLLNTILNIIWLLGLDFAAAFECSPVAGFWDKSIAGATCSPTINAQLGSCIPSVILDLFALIMPLPVIWRLHMRVEKRVLLLGIFVLGYSVIACSLGRLITVIKLGDELQEDLTWYFVDVLVWLNLELLVASTCVSLMSTFSLVQRFRLGGLKALLTSKHLPVNYAGGNSTRAQSDSRGRWEFQPLSPKSMSRRVGNHDDFERPSKGSATFGIALADNEHVV